MASGGYRGSAGERVLESRHVIGLFMAVLVLSGLFFTLGYVMGRNQVMGPVSADLREKPPPPVISKPEAVSKKASKSASTAGNQPDANPPANSDWEFYHAADSKKPEARLKPAPSVNAAAPAPPKKAEPLMVKSTAPSRANNGSTKNNGQLFPGGTYTLQVAALTKEADALDLAKRLQQKKFPAFVLSPKGDKYYRVQVGPYSDAKAADAARKGLEGAGFKAFAKQN